MVRLRRRGAGAHERAPPRYVLPPPEIADTRRLLAASRQSRAAAPKKSPSAAHEHHEPTRALREPTDAPGASKGCAPLSTSWKPDAARHALSSRYLEVRATDGKFASRLAAVALGAILDHPLARPGGSRSASAWSTPRASFVTWSDSCVPRRPSSEPLGQVCSEHLPPPGLGAGALMPSLQEASADGRTDRPARRRSSRPRAHGSLGQRCP